jgi:hypothetical protein
LLKSTLIGKLNPFGGRKNIIVHEQGTNDIIKAMLSAHKIYAADYDKISQLFWTGDVQTTCFKIWKFLKENIKYIIDSDTSQKIMSPAAILAYQGNDCKNYSLFTIGILDSLKRKGIINNKLCYRFASYKILDEIPHHVFAVVVVGNEEIWIDAVLPSFNQKKTYYHKLDYMPLYSISGTNDQIGLFGSQKRKKEFEKAKVEAKAKGLPEPQKPKSKVVLKFALAPARGSFLLLVGLNFMGLATKLKKAFTDNKDKTNTFWSNLGGNTNELLRKTEQGAKKKRILGDYQEGEQIGVVSTAAIAAAAAPILLKVGDLLKSIGIDPQELLQAGKKVVADQAKKVIAKATSKVNQLEEQSEAEVNEAVKQLEGQKPLVQQKTNYIPFILVGGVALYLITKKK